MISVSSGLPLLFSMYTLNSEIAPASSVARPSCSSRAMRARSRATASATACCAKLSVTGLLDDARRTGAQQAR